MNSEINTINISRIVICDYCGKPAKLVSGKTIYPQRPDLANHLFWACDPCRAHIGCHRDSEAVPLGRLANTELRGAKRVAHAAFDPLWQSGKMKRVEAYEWLAEKLNIPFSKCHIGMFDVETCRRVVAVIRENRSEV